MATVARIKAVFAADTKEWTKAFTEAEQKVEATSSRVADRMKTIKANMKIVEAAAGELGNSFQGLEQRAKTALSFDVAHKSLDQLAKITRMSSKEYFELAKSIGPASIEVKKFAAAAAETLGFRTRGQITADIRAAIDAYKILKTEGVASAQEISRAQELLIAKARQLNQEYRTLGAEQKKSLSPQAIAADAAKTLGFRTQSDITAQITAARKAYADLRASGVASVDDLYIAQSKLESLTRTLNAEYANLVTTTRQLGKGGGGLSEVMAQAAGTLGMRTKGQISAEIREAISAYRTLQSSGVSTSKELAEAHQRVTDRVRALWQEYRRMPKEPHVEAIKSTNSLSASFRSLIGYAAAYIGIQRLMAGVSNIARTAVEMASLEKTFYALTGSMAGSRAEIMWLREESQRLGLDFLSLTTGFKGFLAAGKSAGMETEKIKKIFTSVSEAATVLGLNAEKTKLVMYALEQMLSKGTVTMEELRRQLGDSLPGAFQIGAKAMGLTNAEFTKLVSTGKLASEVFLPRFAEALKDAFGPGLEMAVRTPRAEITRLLNELQFAQIDIGAGGFLQGLSDAARELSKSLQLESTKDSLTQLGFAMGKVTGHAGKLGAVLVDNSKVFIALTATIATGLVVSKALIPIILSLGTAYKALAAFAAGAAVATGGWSSVATAAFSLVAGAVVYFSSSLSEGEKHAAKYADSIAAIAQGGEVAAGQIQKIREQYAHFSFEETERELGSVTAKIQSTLKDLRDAAPNFGAGAVEVRKLIKSFRDGEISLEDFQKKLTYLKDVMGADVPEEVLNLSNRLSELYTRSDALRGIMSSVGSAVAEIVPDFNIAAMSASNYAEKLASLGGAFRLISEWKGFKLPTIGMPLEKMVEERTKRELEEFIASLPKEKEAAAKRIVSTYKLTQNQLERVLKGDLSFETDPAKLRELERGIKAIFGKESLNNITHIKEALTKTRGELEQITDTGKKYGAFTKTLETLSQKYDVSGITMEEGEFVWVGQTDKDILAAAKALFAENKRLADAQAAANKARDVGTERVAFQVAQYYKDATQAVTQLQIEQERLTAQMMGDTGEAAAAKIRKSAQAELDKYEDMLFKITSKLEMWKKQGKAGGEAIAEAMQTKSKIEEVMDLIRANEKLNLIIADRATREKEAQAAADFGGLIGNLSAVYAAEIKILEVKREGTSDAKELLAITERIRQARAKEQIDFGGLLQTGALAESKKAAEDYVGIWEDKIPSAFSSAADAFGDMVGSWGDGTTTMSESINNLGKTFNKIMNQMVSDFISASIKMLMYGNLGGSTATSGGGLIGGAFSFISNLFTSTPVASAKGNAFSSGLGSYSNSIVSKPTFFDASSHIKAFAQGGVMGEAGPEAIIPLDRDNKGRLGVKMTENASGKTTVNIFNQSGAEVETRRSTSPTGGEQIDVFIKRIIRGEVTSMVSEGALDTPMQRYGAQRQPGFA